MPFIEHPLIRPETVEARLYQEELAARVFERGSSLVVAPTALGKTVVAVLLAAYVLEKNPEAKIVFLAPTKPLAVQHKKSFEKLLNIEQERIALLTGALPPASRREMWEKAAVVAATPQTIRNDLYAERISLRNVGLLIFDEAHRAVKDYSYVYIARKYISQCSGALILGLTASPGSSEEKIEEVCRSLHIKNIEIKKSSDEDVKPYTKEIETGWIKVKLPEEFLQIKRLLEQFMREQMLFLKKMGYAGRINAKSFAKKQMLELQSIIRRDLQQRGRTQPMLYAAASRVAALLKVSHAHTLLETQGVVALHEYFGRLRKDAEKAGASKAVRYVLRHENIENAIRINEKLYKKGVEHPKLEKLVEILKRQFGEAPESRVLVFNHYRDSIKNLEHALLGIEGIRAKRFIGQATKGEDRGMSQKEQIELINELKEGKYNTLLCSSVAEEGLDIPAVDLVVFFEAVPSEIRAIQRRGRTGRFSKGKVIILMAEGTRDESYYWSSIAKEKRMHRTLGRMQSAMPREGQQKLDFSDAAKNEELGKEEAGENPHSRWFQLGKNERGKEEVSENHPTKWFQLGKNEGGKEEASPERDRLMAKQSTLLRFAESANGEVLVYADSRERNSTVAKELERLGAAVMLRQLETADYVISDEIGIERKTVSDFLSSMLDGRLFEQLLTLASNYTLPLLIVEGCIDDLYSLRKIHKNAVIGALTSIALNYRTPILFTRSVHETAEFIYVTAKREQLGREKDIRLRVGRKGLSLPEQQLFVAESFPLVGPKMAKALLKKFGSIKSIANAKSAELKEVENLGPKKAKYIKRVLTAKFEEQGNS